MMPAATSYNASHISERINHVSQNQAFLKDAFHMEPMTEEERKRMQDAYYYYGPWY